MSHQFQSPVLSNKLARTVLPMATSIPAITHGREDPTFKNYSASAAQAYLKNRRGYSENIINLVMNEHTANGGQTKLLLDVGCGPGQATRALAPSFEHVIGADPGESMIDAAKGASSDDRTKSGESITYEICGAEDLSQLSALKKYSTNGLECVDLITAATAAHWFEMPKFWTQASRILKPGGSVILWCGAGYTCNPNTTPNAAKLHDLWTKFETETLAPYELPGNRLTREFYKDLGMPWEILTDKSLNLDDESKAALQCFPESESKRHEFNRDGYVAPNQQFFSGERRANFEQIKLVLGTASPVTRWREANKEQVERGEVEDIMDMLVRRTKEIMEEVPEGQGRDWIDAGGGLVCLVVKKAKGN
jgi:trans-aconitate 3-methyltransferase